MSEQPTKIAVSDRDGKVILQFSKPITNLVMDPANVMPIAEAIARAAYICTHGKPPASNASIIAQEIRSRVTEQMRDQMVSRVALMLVSLRDQTKSDGYTAMQIVDTVLAGAGV